MIDFSDHEKRDEIENSSYVVGGKRYINLQKLINIIAPEIEIHTDACKVAHKRIVESGEWEKRCKHLNCLIKQRGSKKQPYRIVKYVDYSYVVVRKKGGK